MIGSDLLAKRAKLLVQIDQASRVIAPLWTLSTSIAVNPLWDLRGMTFDEAISYASKVSAISGYPSGEFFSKAFEDGRVTVDDLRSSLDLHTVSSGHRSHINEELEVGGGETIRNLIERYDAMFATNVANIAS